MSYRSRLPQIAAQLPQRLDAVGKLAANRVADGARERVPVGAPTVHLKDKIDVRRGGIGDYAVVAGDSEAFYGHFVEFGTNDTAAQPFLVPAAEEVRGDIQAIARAALRSL